MQIKFTEAEQDHFNRLRTLHAEAQRQFAQLDQVFKGFLACVAANHGAKDGVGTILPDGSGLDVPETRDLNGRGKGIV